MNTDSRAPDNSSPDIAPERIARLLTRAAQQIDADTVSALRRARECALARQAAHRPALALDTGHALHWPIPHTARQWAAAAILLAVLAGGMGYWHHMRKPEANHHLDIAILTDDLPMEIFIDR